MNDQKVTVEGSYKGPSRTVIFKITGENIDPIVLWAIVTAFVAISLGAVFYILT